MQFCRSTFIRQRGAGSLNRNEAVLYRHAGRLHLTIEPNTGKRSYRRDHATEPGHANRGFVDDAYLKCREFGKGGNSYVIFDGIRQRLHSDHHDRSNCGGALTFAADPNANHPYSEGRFNRSTKLVEPALRNFNSAVALS